jgi:4-carboxymuconolactone decarboxylase
VLRAELLRSLTSGGHEGVYPSVGSDRLTQADKAMQPKEQSMNALDPRERELVALGAALASNCVPCIQFHIPEARKTGLTDAQIGEAIQVADKVRQVPARKVLETAQQLLSGAPAPSTTGGCAAATATPAREAGACCA